MDEKHIEQNIQWLRESLQSKNEINDEIALLINRRKNIDSQIIPMIKFLKQLLKKGTINNEDLLGLENIFYNQEEQKENGNKKLIKGKELCDLVYLIFLENQNPLYYKEILLEINNKGFDINGKNPKHNLIAHISKDKRFVRVGGRGCYKINEDYSNLNDVD